MFEIAVDDFRIATVRLHHPFFLGGTRHRHEQRRLQFLLDQFAIAFDQSIQSLLVTLTDRNHHRPALGQLFDQRFGHRFGAARDDDLVKRCRFGPTGKSVADPSVDVLITQPRQHFGGGSAQRFDDFDRVNVRDQW